MRRIFTERNLVVVLFVSALVIFVFAQQDITKAKQLYNTPAVAVMPPSPPQSASIEELEAPAELPVITTEKK